MTDPKDKALAVTKAPIDPNDTAVVNIKKSPLENFFNLPTASKQELEKSETPPIVQDVQYDDKDTENEKLLDDIRNKALRTYDRILDDLEDIDPKYSARTYEVAGMYLDKALQAVEKRVKLKEHKDKLVKSSKKGSTTTNNTLTINTTDLIKQLRAEAIEGEVIDVTPINQDSKE